MRRLSDEEVRQVELGLLDEFVACCADHGLTYYLAYGTALGAARHGGFIPWDDDVDVLMPRADYERFVAGYAGWGRPGRFRVAYHGNGAAPYAFAKFFDATTFVQETYVRKDLSLGVWIDVFPLDDEPLHPRLVYVGCKLLDRLRGLALSDTSRATTPARRALKVALHPLVGRLDPYRLSGRIDRLARDCRKRPGSDNYFDVLPASSFRLLPKSLFAPLEVPFEDRGYVIPAGYDEFLTEMYGDWRTPPPVDQRPRHTEGVFALEEGDALALPVLRPRVAKGS